MKTDYSVLYILNRICAEEIERSEVNFLIELAQKFALTYLKYRYKNLGKVLLAEDVTLQELSIEAIAPLFERNETGRFIKIDKAFNDWVPKIETEETAVFFLNRLVAKSTEKYVSELLRQSDPFFSKILDSINYLILKLNYDKKQILGTTYIVEDADIVRIGTLPDSKFINELPSELFNDNKNAVSKIFEYIKANTDRVPAIPLNALVLKIKQVRALGIRFSEISEDDNHTEIDSIIDNSIKFTINKMNESYLLKGKINTDEAFAMETAIESIVYDMRDGGINPGLHKYLMEKIPELSFEEYEKRYQNIFEYLFKILKKEIVNQLKA